MGVIAVIFSDFGVTFYSLPLCCLLSSFRQCAKMTSHALNPFVRHSVSLLLSHYSPCVALHHDFATFYLHNDTAFRI